MEGIEVFVKNYKLDLTYFKINGLYSTKELVFTSDDSFKNLNVVEDFLVISTNAEGQRREIFFGNCEFVEFIDLQNFTYKFKTFEILRNF